MLKCPECQTVQTTTSPFCENCGYRLRSQATFVEGLAAISPEMLRQSAEALARPERADRADRVERPAVLPSAKQAAQGKPPEPSAPAMHLGVGQERTEPEDDAIIGVMPPRPSRAQTSVNAISAPLPQEPEPLERSSPNVQLEGASAEGKRRAKPRTEERAEVSSLLERPSELSGMYASPQSIPPAAPSKTPLALFGAVWGVITAIGILGAYYVTTHDPHRVVVIVDDSPNGRIEIPSGTFLKGLDESTRSFILRVCLRVSDMPDDECEQDKLLAGEYPQESISLKTFWIDRKEVALADYNACVEAGKCEAISYKDCRVYTPQGLQIALRVPKHLQDPEQPVTCVTRAQAQTYCGFVGGALPSHDQWEKAARGVEGQLFPWGTTWDPVLANWGEFDLIKTSIAGKVDGYAWTAPPGRFEKGQSPYKLWDVAGNVSEWVSGDSLQGHARGGSWTSDPFALRTTGRLSIKALDRRTDVGFRCAYERASR